MTDRQLKKLNRNELLELMLEQSKEIDRLEAELDETKAALAERNLKIATCGSIAEAAAEVNSLFRSAQRAADMYLLNVQRICAEKAEAAGKSEDWEAELRTMNLQGGDGSPGRNSAAEIKTPAVKTPEERIKEGGEGS